MKQNKNFKKIELEILEKMTNDIETNIKSSRRIKADFQNLKKFLKNQ